MPQWRDVDVNFRGSGSAFSDATQAAARAGQGFSDLARTLEEQKRYEAEQARQKGLDERAAKAEKRQQANWEKSFALQQAAEDRAKIEQAAKEATRQGYGKFGELLAQPNLTEAQASRINEMAAKGVAPSQLLKDVEKAHALNRKSLTQQRQLLLEQAPVKELYDTVKDPVTGQEVLRIRGDLDTAQQQALKESMLGNLDRRIDAEATRAQAAQLARESEAAANRRHKQSLAAASERSKPVTLYKADSKGNIVYTQARDNAELQALTAKGGWNLGGNIDRAPTVKEPSLPPLFGASKEAAGIDLDFFGSGDTEQARLLGQRLQNTFKFKPEQVGSILSQSTGRTTKSFGLDTYIDPDKLASALINAGAARNRADAEKAAKTLLAPTK